MGSVREAKKLRVEIDSVLEELVKSVEVEKSGERLSLGISLESKHILSLVCKRIEEVENPYTKYQIGFRAWERARQTFLDVIKDEGR